VPFTTSHFRATGLGATLSLAACVLLAGPARAQDATDGESTTRRAISGSSLGGFVLPMRPIESGLSMSATRGWRWKSDDTQRLLLEGDVRVSIGGYAFSAKRALVWINRLPTASGFVTQTAVWFEEADEPSRRSGLGASGRDLLVTGSYLGQTTLALSLTEDGAPPRSAFRSAGEARLARHLRELAAGGQTLGARPSVDARATRPEWAPRPGDPIAAAAAEPERDLLPDSVELPAPATNGLPIFRPEGTVRFSADDLVVDEKADRIAVQGMVELEYEADEYGDRTLELSAERGVIFLAPGALSALRDGARSLDASLVSGIYLEGAVEATDGEYTMRGAQVFYDLAANRAVVVDAVLRTYDRRRGDLPVYVRAAELRQVAADEWRSDRATVSTSAFFTPHLAIGVERVTVVREPDDAPGGRAGGVFVRAEGAGIEASGTRILPLPGYEGFVDRIPLRSVSAGYLQNRGGEIGTEWDLLALAGAEPVAGLDAQLALDAYTERGVGVGTRFELSQSLGQGVIDLYGLYDTGGDDRTSSGRDVTVDAGLRGVVDAAWQTALSANDTLQAQFAYLSDETFASAWRQRDFANRREYETSLFLNGVRDNTALSLLLKHDLNDFISNSYLLASRGYTVDKLPEASYRRYGDQPFDGVTWSQQWSAGAMSLRPTTGSPGSLGVPFGAWGGAILPGASIEQAYLDAGYRDDLVTRLDTRHEFSVPLSSEWATVTPFVYGQATGYIGDEFAAYSADADNLRLQGGGGVRASMRIVRSDDSVRSRLLDLNRMRHIVEPYGVLWAGYDSLDEGSLPVYDQEYEGATGGSAVNIGIRNTLQTQRGGAGAWQSVDWLRLDAGVVLSDAGSDFTPGPVDPLDPSASLRWAQSPIPAFFSFRPELSQWGSHAYGLLTWQLSDSLTVGGTMTYLFEDRDFVTDDDALLSNLARGSIGVEMRHSPVASTFVEYRYVAPTESELLQAGFLYRAGRRYLVACSPQYDVSAGEMRAVSGAITRTFPDFDLAGRIGYDLVEDRTFFGLSLSMPPGSGGSSGGTFGAYAPTMGVAP
jgi:hypothetical protein